MTASILTRALHLLDSPKSEAVSDKFTSTYLNNFFKKCGCWILCELAERSNLHPVTLAEFSRIYQAFRVVFCELLGCRDVYEFLDSVRSYLRWRQLSTRRKFTPYNRQPQEHRDLGHALWILNQAWNTPELPNARQSADLERWFQESPTLREKYGRDLVAVPCLPRKKSPQPEIPELKKKGVGAA